MWPLFVWRVTSWYNRLLGASSIHFFKGHNVHMYDGAADGRIVSSSDRVKASDLSRVETGA